jgi:hypothetical protein
MGFEKRVAVTADGEKEYPFDKLRADSQGLKGLINYPGSAGLKPCPSSGVCFSLIAFAFANCNRRS